jgi:hypothetical protein
MKYKNIREEELKNKVGADWFAVFDTTEILGNIDFTVFPKQENVFGRTPLLWAEAKTGDFDLNTMFVQLVLTIGKARTFDKTLPPAFLGVFDFKKMAFVSYSSVQDIFYMNDFNWNVTPSNHETKEFKLVKHRIEAILKTNTYVYDYQKDEQELQIFIANNIAKATEESKIKIDKNNFVPIYLRWLETIKPTLDVTWDDLKKFNIVDSDFYLADLFVDDKDTADIADDITIRDNLFVVFERQHYRIPKKYLNTIFDAGFEIKDKITYQNFWKRYKRPPIAEFQDYIIERRDLLVPQDIRERKGAFFTPRQWVELSQKYLADVLGENWQEEYYIWDCAAGTGNLLAGLTNKYSIFASTLDQADVQVMHERIAHGANLLEKHCFQFDFLNDDFTKLPQNLQDIINDPEKRKKLVMYINPPYAEATSAKTVTGTGENKANVAKNKIREKYRTRLNGASNEIFALFMARIYDEIPNAKLAQFSKLKFVQGINFVKFRDFFRAKYLKGFIVRANTFDNVVGTFPIGFTIWDIALKETINKTTCDIIDNSGFKNGEKVFYGELPQSINKWVKFYDNGSTEHIAYMGNPAPDFQHNSQLYLSLQKGIEHFNFWAFTKHNLFFGCVYFTVRQVIAATWLNDRDQFLYPNDGWKSDTEFQNDCLTFTLFYSQNRITNNDGINHWIPFTESEVNAQEKFTSNFMTDFIKGKIKPEPMNEGLLFATDTAIYNDPSPKIFSPEATALFDAGRALWTYYHAQKGVNVNASLYDIREHFQGRNDKGRMNARSTDEQYTQLIGNLRARLSLLADKIAPKVYEYEFLKA